MIRAPLQHLGAAGLALLLSATPVLGSLGASQATSVSIGELAATPDDAEEGDRIRMAATASHPAEATPMWSWDFGDGESRSGVGLSSVTHVYRDEGEYTVTLVVSAADASASRTLTVSVGNAPPEIVALTAPGQADVGEMVELQAIARDPGADDVLEYRWSFGDGAEESGSELRETTHTFTEPGVYPVELTVDDGDGGSHSRIVVVAVERSFEVTLSGAVSADLDGGFDERPQFTALGPGQAERHPASLPALPGHCTAYFVLSGEAGSLTISGMLPAPLREGSYAVAPVDEENLAGRFTVVGRIGRSTGLASASGGSITLTRIGEGGVEGSLDGVALLTPAWGRDQSHVAASGWFSAEWYGGVDRALGEESCIPSSTFAIDRVRPAPDARNVDWEEPGIEVALSSPFDAATLGPETFRLEYRLPGGEGPGGVGSESYEQVEGLIEPTNDRVFRFVPEEPLLDGVVYRATVVGGEEGVRGQGGETMENDRVWRFSTLVEPDDIRVATFQVARNAPLVPGKTTLTRVYVDWEEKEGVHPEWQVIRFLADVEVEVSSSAGAYPAKEATLVTRPDQFTPDDSAQARNSINFFGWEPSGTGGSSTITATVEATDQDRSPPRRFESGPLTIDHHTASPRLTLEARRLLVGPWEQGLPAAIRSVTATITREGGIFAEQNFPVAGIGSRLGDLAVDEPALMFSWTQSGGLETYRGLSETGITALKQDEYLARRAHDAMMAAGSEADLFVVFMPSEFQPGPSGYAYDGFPTPTVVVFLTETFSAQTVQIRIGTVAHEIGHAFGLDHKSACPDYQHQRCLQRGKEGSDDIEGFRLDPDGTGGSNKSETEGNAEAPRTRAVLSLMYHRGLPAPVHFILNEQYAELLTHPRLATASPVAETRWARSVLRESSSPGPSSSGPDVRLATAPVGGTGGDASEVHQATPRFQASGVVTPDGRLLLEPLSIVESPRPAPTPADPIYSFEVLDAAGEVLHEAPFGLVPFGPDRVRGEADAATDDLAPGTDVDAGSGGWFWVSTPRSAEAATVVVTREGETLMRLERSPNPPRIRIEESGAGSDEEVALAWSATDADGDPLAYTLEYSPDGEGDWQTLTLPWTARTELRIERSHLPEGPTPTFRVTATDGFNSDDATLELPGG